MAGPGSVYISSTGLNDVTGSSVINGVIGTYATTPVLAKVISPFAGAQSNTITIPSGATGAFIVPPGTNTSSISLRGNSGDTGVGISRILPTLLTFDATTPANFVLTSGGAIPSPGVVIAFF